MAAKRWALWAGVFGALVAGGALAEERAVPAGELERGIRARCEREWSGDFQMQLYCVNQQIESARDAADTMSEVSGTAAGDQIIGHCFDEWSDDDGPNWQMVDYCMDSQLEAYRALNR